MSNSESMGIKERLSYWRESLICWWDWHGGFEGIWDDLVSPIQWKWESFKMWRRKRNPELVELDAYRELVGIEKRLQEWPRAKPLLEAALRNYEITGQDDKKLEIARRLREADPFFAYLGFDDARRGGFLRPMEGNYEPHVRDF